LTTHFLVLCLSRRDVKWATFTCVYNWHVKGAHKTAYSGEEVVTLHTPTTVNPDYLACGTNFGYLRLHAFPCVPMEESEFHRYPAHVDEVGAVRFSYDSSKLLSIGRQDRAILLWDCVKYANDDNTKKLPDLDLPASLASRMINLI
jgi:hypothetical protein